METDTQRYFCWSLFWKYDGAIGFSKIFERLSMAVSLRNFVLHVMNIVFKSSEKAKVQDVKNVLFVKEFLIRIRKKKGFYICFIFEGDTL